MKLSINWYVTSSLIDPWGASGPVLTFINEQWTSRGIGADGVTFSQDDSGNALKDRFKFL